MNNEILSLQSVAKNITDLTYTDYFYRLMLLARSVFEWEGLPNGMDEKWIERFLFSEGSCMFFKHKTLGFMVSKCTEQGTLNEYDEPTKIMPYYANTGDTSLIDVEALENHVDCVLIRNNDIMLPTSRTIQLFALRLAEITRTIDININAQKTPTLILCSDKQKMTMKNVYKQWNGFEPVIYGDKNLDIEDIKVLKTDAPIVFPELQIQKHAIWNECMTFLGINNANQDKRERLVADEVSANDSQIEQAAYVMLKAREQACEEINKLFGLNISVKLRSSLDEILKHSEASEDLGREENLDDAC